MLDRWLAAHLGVVSAALAVLLACVWIAYLSWGSGLVAAIYGGELPDLVSVVQSDRRYTSPDRISRVIEVLLAGVTLTTAGVLAGLRYADALAARRSRWLARYGGQIFDALILAGCVFVCFFFLLRGWEGEAFYDIESMMTNPQAQPIFGHRLLFVGVAWVAKLLMPAASLQRCFFISQAIALGIAFYFVQRWSRLFISPPLAFTGLLLATLMLAPTFGYFNFYDVGIVAFFTAMLYFLFTRHHAAYLGVFALATFNHENNLLMAPVAALIARGNLRGWRYWAFVAAQPALYVLARVALNWWLPTTRLWDPRPWRNLMYLTTPTLHLVLSVGTFLFWYACALLGYRYAGRDLKVAVLLFPQLVAVTFLFGKFSETRQFDAFIPVAVGLILRFLDVRTDASRGHAPGGAAG